MYKKSPVSIVVPVGGRGSRVAHLLPTGSRKQFDLYVDDQPLFKRAVSLAHRLPVGPEILLVIPASDVDYLGGAPTLQRVRVVLETVAAGLSEALLLAADHAKSEILVTIPCDGWYADVEALVRAIESCVDDVCGEWDAILLCSRVVPHAGVRTIEIPVAARRGRADFRGPPLSTARTEASALSSTHSSSVAHMGVLVATRPFLQLAAADRTETVEDAALQLGQSSHRVGLRIIDLDWADVGTSAGIEHARTRQAKVTGTIEPTQ